MQQVCAEGSYIGFSIFLCQQRNRQSSFQRDFVLQTDFVNSCNCSQGKKKISLRHSYTQRLTFTPSVTVEKSTSFSILYSQTSEHLQGHFLEQNIL